MSRIRIVRGKIKKRTGGNHVNYSAGSISRTAFKRINEQGINGGLRYKKPEIPELATIERLKKFLVHFRRPDDYDGKYGFDWLRDEYIYPLVTVGADNNGQPIGKQIPLCKQIETLKAEYRDRGVSDPIVPYGKDYYPAWLALFPYTTSAEFSHGSRMHKNGVDLDLEIEELEQLVVSEKDETEILFEASHPCLFITPSVIKLKELLTSRQTKSLGKDKSRNFYHASKQINIKCQGDTLDTHGQVKVFAKSGDRKLEVGKLMVYKNNVIPKAEITVVNVITDPTKRGSLKDDYQYLFKHQSFNQALIRAEVRVDTEFDLTLMRHHNDVDTFLNNCNSYRASVIRDEIVSLYDKYGKYAVPGGINTNNTHRTFLFFTTLKAGGVRGICSLDQNNNWGNSYLLFNIGLQNARTIVHECAHSLGLPHTFEEGPLAMPHIFYQGYTDAYMDYDWNRPGNPNPFQGKMHSFYKWQWERMRNDRSLIKQY